MHYSVAYGMNSDAELIAAVLFAIIYCVFAGGAGVLLYVFRSIGVYSIAKRRGLNHAWFAWVPVVNNYLLGSLSDQYQYVVKGKIKSKRKWLLGLTIAMFVLSAVVMALGIGTVVSFIGNSAMGFGGGKMEKMVLRTVLGLAVTAVPLAVVSVAVAVIRYVALYDVYTSVDPKNDVMYIILSVIFRITEPFFLFFNRKKDDGMPPRREQKQTVWEAPSTEAEGPWADN